MQPKKSCYTSFWSSWPKKFNSAMMPSLLCDTDTGISGIIWPKSHVALHFELELRKCSSAIDDAISIKSYQSWWPDALHDPKHHVAPNFDCLDLRNVLVPLTMPLPSCDAVTEANCVTWPKKPCCTSYFIILQWCHLQCHW